MINQRLRWGRSSNTLSARRRVKRRIKRNIITPAAATEMVAISPLEVRKVNSKKFRVNGIRKAPSMMPIMTVRSVPRRRFSGREIQ